jgi:hypothetical protein
LAVCRLIRSIGIVGVEVLTLPHGVIHGVVGHGGRREVKYRVSKARVAPLDFESGAGRWIWTKMPTDAAAAARPKKRRRKREKKKKEEELGENKPIRVSHGRERRFSITWKWQ